MGNCGKPKGECCCKKKRTPRKKTAPRAKKSTAPTVVHHIYNQSSPYLFGNSPLGEYQRYSKPNVTISSSPSINSNPAMPLSAVGAKPAKEKKATVNDTMFDNPRTQLSVNISPQTMALPPRRPNTLTQTTLLPVLGEVRSSKRKDEKKTQQSSLQPLTTQVSPSEIRVNPANPLATVGVRQTKERKSKI